ncbi:hypothetical protein F3Y22_tig00015498pilonHSYRG00070 [Hibiscus syriacus]|uniref:Uncharacterized protein n=1 Tax=Hibiscus syriacus TaxID=106335 RepID=A0A6A3BXZ4_HIBSY|nr:hypothetical protein F3Y22_tig00015498pilonHSYRG00070 [Hibiscus syriacus]
MPGSPKVTSFPSLPDMSPMKVSAKHNVYVSPLRASKMDALISHSSRSYYACVGEYPCLSEPVERPNLHQQSLEWYSEDQSGTQLR